MKRRNRKSVGCSKVSVWPAGALLWPMLAGCFCGSSLAGSVPVNFANTNAITINASTNPPTMASPYPSTIAVTGLAGRLVSKVTVTLFNFSHPFPDDVDIVLVGPEGTNAVVMSNVGGGNPGATNVTLTLDDSAPSSLPLGGPLVSGTFQPTQRLAFGFPWPAPAPASPGGPSFAVFNGTEPNGIWSLFVIDDSNPSETGIIAGGWSLNIITIPVFLQVAAKGTNAVLSWTNAASGYSLQMSPTLTHASAWTNVPITPVIVSGQYTVTNPIAGTERFYRLIK